MKMGEEEKKKDQQVCNCTSYLSELYCAQSASDRICVVLYNMAKTKNISNLTSQSNKITKPKIKVK